MYPDTHRPLHIVRNLYNSPNVDYLYLPFESVYINYRYVYLPQSISPRLLLIPKSYQGF